MTQRVDARTRSEKIRDAIYDQTGEFTQTDVVIAAGNAKWIEVVRYELNRMVTRGLLELTKGRPKTYRWTPDD